MQTVGPWKTRRPTRKAMLGGRFYVYGSVEELRPPIEWLLTRGYLSQESIGLVLEDQAEASESEVAALER